MSASLVDDIVIEGTPASVLQRYRSLEERAKHCDFGPLEEDIIVLDTETTGLSFSKCELIEIAAVRMSGREVVDSFQMFVKPKEAIPPEITNLTGISNRDVYDAAAAPEVVRALADFVDGSPVIAHNAIFDRSFIERVKGGTKVSDWWIDTLALSRIALPRLKTHKLSDMAHAFGAEAVTHRAMADVEALHGMWRIFLLALSDLPQGLLRKFATMHEEREWQFRQIFSYLATLSDDEPFSLKSARALLLQKETLSERSDALENTKIYALDKKVVTDSFAQGSYLSDMYENYEVRPEQIEMAQEVSSGLSTSTHRCIEAGTGVGKSMAYILPSVMFAQKNGVSVGIATKTNALSDQLLTSELPALAKVFPHGFSYVSLKGFEHYVCLHRMEQSCVLDLPLEQGSGGTKGQRRIQNDLLNALAIAYSESCQATEGDVDGLGIAWNNVPHSFLTIQATECLHTACPFFPHECMVYRARKKAVKSDIVVTNHALLLRDIAMGGKILPSVRHWIIDEAHGFEGEARRQWAKEVSGRTAKYAFEQLGNLKLGAIHQAMIHIKGHESATLPQRLLTKLSASAERSQVSCSKLFSELHHLGTDLKDKSSYTKIVKRIDESLRASDEWIKLKKVAEKALRNLEETSKNAKETQTVLSAISAQAASAIGEAGSFITELFDNLRLIIEGTDKSYVFSLVVFRTQQPKEGECFLAEKVDIGSDLTKTWYPETMSVTYTSATMAVNNSFEHFEKSVGLSLLSPDKYSSKTVPSSFDYEHNMAVIALSDLPEPSERGYLDSLCEALVDIHLAMEGSVLTLFTNRREMQMAHEVLYPRLLEAGIELLIQDGQTSPRRLREKFIANKSCSLLALKSFWEGFDAVGETLRCVVIAKLPFANPQEPLVQEREARDPRAWWHYSLPEAVIETKQAAGRLIRSSTDEGIVILADSRLVHKRYGKQFMQSLPNPNYLEMQTGHVKRYIEMWRASRRA